MRQSSVVVTGTAPSPLQHCTQAKHATFAAIDIEVLDTDAVDLDTVYAGTRGDRAIAIVVDGRSAKATPTPVLCEAIRC